MQVVVDPVRLHQCPFEAHFDKCNEPLIGLRAGNCLAVNLVANRISKIISTSQG
jgi:hypothetical protein